MNKMQKNTYYRPYTKNEIFNYWKYKAHKKKNYENTGCPLETFKQFLIV